MLLLLPRGSDWGCAQVWVELTGDLNGVLQSVTPCNCGSLQSAALLCTATAPSFETRLKPDIQNSHANWAGKGHNPGPRSALSPL